MKLGGAAIANAQVNTQVSHDLAHAELLAFPFIFLLSLLFFRSLVAALLPPLLGGLAIVTTFFALRIVSSFVDLSVFALNLTTGLGLGLAIDYSLFMVSRYREESAKSGFGLDGAPPHAADRGPHDRLQLADGRRRDRVAGDLPAAVPLLDGDRRRARRAARRGLALTVLPALLSVLGPRVNALAPELARPRRRTRRPTRRARRLVPAVAPRHAPPARDRDRRAPRS